MNTASLQLEGLYLSIAALNNALVQKGLLSREELDQALRKAEQTALGDDQRVADLSASNREAAAFAPRLLALANDMASETETPSFSELSKMVGTHSNGINDAPPDPPDSDGEVFYESASGDRWLLVTDAGGRRFVRHLPNRSSGGVEDVTDLQSFRDREPHTAQNQALERLLNEAT